MKILFYYRNNESLGIEYLSAVLKRAGHEVDLIFDPGLDNTFFYQNRFLKVFQRKDLLVEKAVGFSPDLIAFSSITNEYPDIKMMAGMLNKRLKVPTIIGGIHPTAIPKFVLSDTAFDMVCLGEGEEALLELVERMDKGRDYSNTRNIWIKKGNGNIIKNEVRPLISNLDSLPFPDKSLFHKYGCFKDTIQVLSGRGCAFSCSYCSNHFQQKLYEGKGNYLRRRSVENMISELKEYKQKYKGIKKIAFDDDLFVYDKNWLKEFSYYYVREIKIPFTCFGFFAKVDQESLDILKKSGCRELMLGVESGSEIIRKKILNRRITNQDIKHNMKVIKKHKIPVRSTAMFGIPNESPQQMWETVSLFEELNPNEINAYIFYPYPETDIFWYCRKKGLLDHEAVRKIFNGEGSNVEESIFEYPHKDLAYMISKLLPVLVRLPVFLRFPIRKLMSTRMKRLANIIFLLCIPLLYQGGYPKLKSYARMMLVHLKKSNYKI